MAGQDQVVMGDDADSGDLAAVFDDLQKAILAQQDELHEELTNIKNSIEGLAAQILQQDAGSSSADKHTLSTALNRLTERLAAVETAVTPERLKDAHQHALIVMNTTNPMHSPLTRLKVLHEDLYVVLKDHAEAMGRERDLERQNLFLGIAFLFGVVIGVAAFILVPPLIF